MMGAGWSVGAGCRQIGFAIAATDAEWRAAMAAPQGGVADGGFVVPLPPHTDCATQAQLEAVTGLLAKRGITRSVPVEVVIGIGTLGAISARLFGWLTGSPLIILPPERASLTNILAVCAGKRTALLCCDTHPRTFGLLEFSNALGSTPVEFGFVYAFDLASALIAALKAAFEPRLEPDLGTHVVNGASGPKLDETFGDLRVVCGTVVEPERLRELLSAPSCAKILVSHGNGFDFNLGRSVLCCIDGTIPKIEDPYLFPCFQTGECIRTAQTRIPIRHVRADLLVMATCWGVLDGAEEVDYTRTAYAPLVTTSNTWSLITAVRQWTAGSKEWLRFLGALSESRTLGEATRRLNARLDPLHAAFLLFGNPNSRLQMPADLALSTLEPGSSAWRLPAGFRTLRIAPRAEKGNLVVYGDANEPSEAAELFVEQESSKEWLLAFCQSPFSVVWAPRQSLTFDLPAYQRLSRGAASAARLMRDLDIDDDGALTDRIREARRLSTLLARALDGRRFNAGYVLLAREHLAATLVDDRWRALTREIIASWSAWATHGTHPRFWFEEWRSEFLQTAAFIGPICSSCGKQTRSQSYACLAELAPDRVLTFCRICSTKSDMPQEGAPTIVVRSIVHRDTLFEARFAIENRTAHPMLVGAAVYIMSATDVWPDHVSSPAVAWIDEAQALEQTFNVPKPEAYVPGSHWLVLVGLVDGVPWTHCERVVLRQTIESGEDVWLRPARQTSSPFNTNTKLDFGHSGGRPNALR